jgi:1,4-dihydroxy-6-naphthoate synthase
MLKLAFSPCPNDTFIFDALVNKRINTEGLKVKYQMYDVETLNRMALAGEADMIKVSYFTYLLLQQNYLLLDSGSAMGFGNGPLLIGKSPCSIEDLQNMKIALPGLYTTAHMLFRIAVPMVAEKQFMLFSEIEDAVLSGKADAGVIIHENRFTYQQKGLKLILDLGSYWEQLTKAPIPLGGIIVRKGLGYDTINKLNRIMFRSVEYAMKNPEAAMPFVRENAQEMDDSVMQQHIGLYVNQNTLSLGTAGRVAITKLNRIAVSKGLLEP